MKNTVKVTAAQTAEKTPENRAAQAAQGDVWERAAAELRTACAAVKGKKAELVGQFQELDKGRAEFGKVPMEIPSDTNPFDTAKIDAARRETGSPVTERKWAAIAKALRASVFRDEDFRGSLIEALDAVRQEAVSKDWELQAAVNAAESARKEAIRAADAAVAQAEKNLAQHRRRFADDFVSPVLDADNYGADNIPAIFREPAGLRNIGLRFGAGEAVETQIQTLWGVMKSATRPKPDGDPYHHLTHHAGEPIPGLSRGVAWTYDGGAGKRPSVAGAGGYVRTGGPLAKSAPRPKREG